MFTGSFIGKMPTFLLFDVSTTFWNQEMCSWIEHTFLEISGVNIMNIARMLLGVIMVVLDGQTVIALSQVCSPGRSAFTARVPTGQEKVRKKWKSEKVRKKSGNFYMGHGILKSPKGQEKVRKYGIDISMKASFQILTVGVMMWLPSLATAIKKYRKTRKCISIVFGHSVNQAII